MTNPTANIATTPSAFAPNQVLDTMISLARITTFHRVIIAGSESMQFYLALRRRGFIRVAQMRVSVAGSLQLQSTAASFAGAEADVPTVRPLWQPWTDPGCFTDPVSHAVLVLGAC